MSVTLEEGDREPQGVGEEEGDVDVVTESESRELKVMVGGLVTEMVPQTAPPGVVVAQGECVGDREEEGELEEQ